MDTKGTHLLLEYWGCDAEAIASQEIVEQAMLEAAVATGATVIHRYFKKFDPQCSVTSGVSGAVIIAESHLTIHTWPEHGYASVDIYTCGNCVPARADRVLHRAFKAGPRDALTLERGLGPTNSIRVQL